MLFININKGLKRTYTTQIYRQLRDKIMHGELKSGERLPATRMMSNELGVSRNTILSAYDMLMSEGYVQSVLGSGVYVSHGTQAFTQPEKMDEYQVGSLETGELPPGTINFDSGIPALDLFPRGKWNRLITQAFNEAPLSALGYDYPQGRPELRRVLAAYLIKVRGVNCHPEQIIITTGTKQGLSLIAKCLLNNDSEVWLEDPSNHNVKQIFSYHTNRITPIAVDSEGIQTNLFSQNKVPDFIFVTPSHQFPMGGILSIQRRLALAQFAKDTGCYIVEDDYDSEFRYNGEPVNSLYELNNQQVIYVGTFSKILFPSLRLGYIVLPYPLIEQCREWKRLGDHHSNSINQLALMRFIESGELERHIMKMKKIYRKRRDFMLSLLDKYFPDQIKVYGAPAGMHIVAEFKGISFSPELVRRIKDTSTNIIPVENHALIKGAHTGQIILGYAHLNYADMEQGIIHIKSVLKSL
ncbi:MAG: PLP-dependent aminotransferase family protein [Lachnospiraceae bacterium]